MQQISFAQAEHKNKVARRERPDSDRGSGALATAYQRFRSPTSRIQRANVVARLSVWSACCGSISCKSGMGLLARRPKMLSMIARRCATSLEYRLGHRKHDGRDDAAALPSSAGEACADSAELRRDQRSLSRERAVHVLEHDCRRYHYGDSTFHLK